MEMLGAAASLIEIGRFLADAFGRLRASGTSGNEVDVEIRAALDGALGRAVRATSLSPPAQEQAFNGLRDILLNLDAADLGELLGGRVTPGLFKAIGDVDPNLGSLIEDFGRRFRQDLVERASRPNNPLFPVAVMSGLQALHTSVQSVYDVLHKPDPSMELPTSTVPSVIAELLFELADEDRLLATRLARWIADPATREANLLHLGAMRSNSFVGHSRLGWMVVAELAFAVGANDVACVACEELASSDERPSWRAFWQAQAASLTDNPLDALNRFRSEELPPGGHAYVECLIAIEEQDVDTLIRVGDEAAMLCKNAAFRALGAKAAALRIRGRIDDAIETLDRIATNGRTGLQLQLAEYLGVRAAANQAVDRLGDARRAYALAIDGIASRRAWSGNSAAAVVVACQAAAAMDDWEAVRRIGSHDRGGATEEEASHPIVIDLVAVADAFLNDASIGPAGAASTSTQAWIRGVTMQGGPGHEDEVIAAFREAVDDADGTTELERGLRGLAVHGVHPLPRLADLASDEPDIAATLDALARYRRNKEQAALAELRRLANQVRLAAVFVAKIEFEDGNPAVAAALASDAAERFGDPNLHLMAAEGLLASDSIAADQLAAKAIDGLPPGTLVRRQLRMIRVQIAHNGGDPRATRDAALAAIADGAEDNRLHWLVVQSDLALNRADSAWEYIEREDLTPGSEQEAIVFLQAHAYAAPAISTAALDVLDEFQDSHDVMAVGLLLRLTIRQSTEPAVESAIGGQSAETVPDAALLADVNRRYGAHLERFLRTFPDTDALRSVPTDPDDPASVIEAMEAEMPKLSDDAVAALEGLSRHVDAGDAPVGAVVAIANGDHLSLVVSGSNSSVPTIPDDRRLGAEVESGRQLLSQDVIVDVSTVASLSLTPSSWPLVTAAVARLSIVSSQRQDIEFHAAQQTSVGQVVRTPDGMRFLGRPESDIEAVRTRFDWMRARAAELPQELPALAIPVTQLGDLEGVGTWAHALHVAHATNRPLLCDDVGLAALARAHGITACGAYALLLAATERNLIARGDFVGHLGHCFDRLVVDLPLTPGGTIELARTRGLPRSPLLNVIARPAYWRKPGALDAYETIIKAVLAHGDEHLEALVSATVSGASRVFPSDAAAGFASAVLTHLIFSVRVQPVEFRTIVDAVRTSWRLDGDPLPLMIANLAATMAQAGQDGQAISAFARELGSRLDDVDQAIVARTVLLTDLD